jgi:hypothetical protein
MAFWKNKEKERFYLLPGQGGTAARRKHRFILLWSVVFGLIASAAFAGMLIWIERHPLR